MKRRGFLKLLGSVALSLEVLAVSGINTFKNKIEEVKYVLNPEYENARYEIVFQWHNNAFNGSTLTTAADSYPFRGNKFDVEGKLISIPPFIAQS